MRRQYKSTTDITVCRFSNDIGPINEWGELPAGNQMNRLKFKTAGELPITSQEFTEHTSREIDRKISTWNQLELETLRF